MPRKQLKVFNSIRAIAQKIEHDLFQEEYKKIMYPLLDKFKAYGDEADNSTIIENELNDFIKSMHRKAVDFQYIPFQRDKQQENKEQLFKDHEKLLNLELLCKDLMIKRK